MKKEEISDLIDMVNEQRDSCGMITRDELIKNIQEIIQQNQTKEVSDEEIRKESTKLSHDSLEQDCFFIGAKWMRNKMKQ